VWFWLGLNGAWTAADIAATLSRSGALAGKTPQIVFGRLLCGNHDQHLAVRRESSLARSRSADEYLIDFDDAF
jgi:hypothetical protein